MIQSTGKEDDSYRKGRHSRIVSRVNVMHVELTESAQLTDLEITTIDVARTVARFAIAGELNCTTVVDVERRDALLEPKFTQQLTRVNKLKRTRGCSDDLCFCRRHGDARLSLAGVNYARVCQHKTES